MDRLLVIEPRDLILRLELGNKCQATIQLKNVMHTMPIAFKVQPSAPKCYTVKPAHGMLGPLEDVHVVITLLPQIELPESVPYSDDKFVVKSVVVPGGLENGSVHLSWFSANKKQVYADHSVRVFLVGGSILRKLVEVGLMEDIRRVLELDETLVNSRDGEGSTAMHIAIASGRPDLVQLLLEFGADMEVKNKLGQTALHLAAARGEALIVELLLAKGAKVNARTPSGLTALHVALTGGHADVVKLLFEKGAGLNELAVDGMFVLHMGVAERRYSCLEKLLQMGVDVSQRGRVDGNGALHWALEKPDTKVLEVKNKAAWNSPTDIERAKEQPGRYLVDELGFGDQFRSDVHIPDVQTCLKSGVVLDRGDEDGCADLHWASSSDGHTTIIRTLPEAGVDLECRDNTGYAPLGCAVDAGNKEFVDLLLKHRDPVIECPRGGMTALDIAARICHSGIVSLILELGSCRRRRGKDARIEQGTRKKGPGIGKEKGTKYTEKRSSFKRLGDFSPIKFAKVAIPALKDVGMAMYPIR